MQIVFGHFPMTIPELSAWARAQDNLTVRECAIALHKLDYPKTVTIRRVQG